MFKKQFFIPENDGKHLESILEAGSCKKHNAPHGIPCWTIRPGSTTAFGHFGAACGNRIKRAGFNGKISDNSLSSKGGRQSGQQRPRTSK